MNEGTAYRPSVRTIRAFRLWGFVWPLLVTVLAACSGSSSHDGGTTTSGHWDKLPDMPAARSYVGVAAIGDRVFVLGGSLGTDAAAFDTKAQTWQTLEPLSSGFYMPNVAAVGDRLFVVGARQNPNVLTYDDQGHWVQRTPMPFPDGRGAAAVGVWGTKIILAGGIIPGLSNNGLNTGVRKVDVVAYDTMSDTWQTLAPMTEARGYSMGAVIGDRFWVIGGSTNDERTAAVQVLDLASGAWMDEKPLDYTLSSAAVALLDGRMYLIGGVMSAVGTISQATLLFQTDTGAATELAPMLTPRFACGGAALNGHIYVAGGIMASAMNFEPTAIFDVFTP